MVRSSSVDQRFGDALGGTEGGGGHDVQVAGVRGQVMGCTFHFQEDGGFQATEAAETRDVHGLVFRNDIELDFLLEAVARHVGRHGLHHFFDGGFHCRLVSCIRQHVHGVAHQQGRLGRVQDDDGLALLGTTDHLDGLGGGFGELVDVGTGAGAGRLTGNRRNDFGVMHLGHARHGCHHRNRSLATTGDHVHVTFVQVLFQVHYRHAVGADGRRRQVHNLDVFFVATQEHFVVHVRASRGGIKHDVDVGKFRHLHQAVHAFVGGGHAHTSGTGQAVGFRVDTDHGAHFDVLAVTQDLDHQVGADVARADDGGFDFLAHNLVLVWSGSDKAHRSAANPANVHTHGVTGFHRLQRHQGARQDDFTCLQGNTKLAQGVGQPGHAVHWRAQRGCAGAGADDGTVLLHHHAAGHQVDIPGRNRIVTQHKQAAGGVVRDGVLNRDLPVLDAGIDNLETGHHTLGGRQYVGVGHARAGQILFQDEGNFAFGTGGNQAVADGHRFTAVEHHVVGQVTEIRLVNVQHVHHRLAGNANLLADYPGTGLLPALKHAQGDVIGILDADVFTTAGQRGNRFPLDHGFVEFVAELLDFLLVHWIHPGSLELDAHVLHFGVELQGVHTALTANTGLLAAAKGRAQIPQEPAVHPDDACFNLASNSMGTAHVLGPDGRGQAVRQAVGQLDRFFFSIERADITARAEDLVGYHGGIVRQARPDRGLYPGSPCILFRHLGHATASNHRGTVFHRLLVVGQHFLAVLEADQRAKVCLLVIGRANAQLFRFFFQTGHKLVENGAFNVNTLGTQAHLTAVDESGTHSAFDSLVHVAVGEYQAGVLATQLQGDVPNALSSRLHDGLAGGGFTGKGETIHVLVLGQELTRRIPTKAVYHVVHAVRHASIFHYLAQQRRGGWGFFRRLHHNGVATGQCRTDFPGHQQQRQVPGADHTDHALGATDRKSVV